METINYEEAAIGVVPDVSVMDQAEFIQLAREGISGVQLRQAVKVMGNNRQLFANMLETTPGNLHRQYRKVKLGRAATEEVLDALRVYQYAVEVFENDETAQDWFQTPVAALAGEKPMDLFDTFEGRAWVMSVLRKVEHGEFS